MTARKEQRPTMEAVHTRILDATHDASKNADAIDAIKAYGIDDFFCEYDKHVQFKDHYIFAAKLYHGSKQHWRRKA
jgi:hypothetical protein